MMMFVLYNYKVKHRISLYKCNHKGYLTMFLLLTSYAVLDYTGGDFFGYYSLYQNSKMYGSTLHMEPVYGWLIRHTGNYYQWRFAVWGGATLLWVMTIKRMKQDVDYAALMFLLLVFYNFVAGRQTIGFSFIFFGLSVLLCRDKGKIIQLLMGVALILCSLYFHRTMIVYCILLLFAMIPFRKWGIYILLLAFPVLFYGFDTFMKDFVNLIGGLAEDSSERMQFYLNSDFRAVSNIFGIIRTVIERLPVFLLLGYSVYTVLIKNSKQPFIYETLLRLTFLLIYISFLFSGQEVSAYIAPRFWDAALFPMTLFASYYMFSQRERTFIRVCTFMLIFAKLFYVFYEVYSV